MRPKMYSAWAVASKGGDDRTVRRARQLPGDVKDDATAGQRDLDGGAVRAAGCGVSGGMDQGAGGAHDLAAARARPSVQSTAMDSARPVAR